MLFYIQARTFIIIHQLLMKKSEPWRKSCVIFVHVSGPFFINLKFASPCIIIQFKQISQLDATIYQVYYLTFMYSSTCFGRPHAHHQDLNCSNSLWFYFRCVVIAVLLVVVGPGRSDHDQQHCYHNAPTVKPEAATAVVVAPDG